MTMIVVKKCLCICDYCSRVLNDDFMDLGEDGQFCSNGVCLTK